MLKSRNYLDWMNDLGTRLNLRDVSTQFISVAIATNSFVESVCEMANKEVPETPTSMFSLVACPRLEIRISFDSTLVPSITQHPIPGKYRPDKGMIIEHLTGYLTKSSAHSRPWNSS